MVNASGRVMGLVKHAVHRLAAVDGGVRLLQCGAA